MENIRERQPDVEVVFEFNGIRKNPCFNGYTPSHLIKEDYLTAGMHRYYKKDFVEPDGTAKGTITFITPEVYPNTLWIGKKITIYEGEREVGTATVVLIFNENLLT